MTKKRKTEVQIEADNLFTYTKYQDEKDSIVSVTNKSKLKMYIYLLGEKGLLLITVIQPNSFIVAEKNLDSGHPLLNIKLDDLYFKWNE